MKRSDTTGTGQVGLAATAKEGAKSKDGASSIPLALKLGLFVFFVLTRAVHPLVIDASKSDGKILYSKNTPIAMNKLLTVVLMNLVGLVLDGWKGVRVCWQPQCLAVFGMVGVVYALGDALEMLSMASLTGGVYQVLLQTKLLITALMLWKLKGTKQSSLQWHVLLAMFLAMSAFVIIDMGGGGETASLPLGAVGCVMAKVAVSCYCAVLSEKYLKAYDKMPTYAKVSALSVTWTLASLLACTADPKVLSHGFFAHWETSTWIVTASFVVKTTATMYLLQSLDSVQKNIGEAVAVIVIYASEVILGKSFEISVFLTAIAVVTLVRVYLLTSKKAPAVAPKPIRLVPVASMPDIAEIVEANQNAFAPRKRSKSSGAASRARSKTALEQDFDVEEARTKGEVPSPKDNKMLGA